MNWEGVRSGGLYIESGTLVLDSSILSNNTGPTYLQDLGGASQTVVGSHNLVESSQLQLPLDTIENRDPLLGPLANNGGATKTRGLAPGSVAIDAGTNTHGLDDDQRGSGYPRTIGTNTDIGAVEFSVDLFANGFDP